jgi:protoporphyrin/coproporphyrin ferrochelatase
MSRTGVLLLGFGGPDSIEAVGPFMCNLMDREPSDELVERVCRRYLTIGGSSPLVGIARDIATGLESRLSDAARDVPVRVGMRYWEPYIDEALNELADLGCDRVVTVSLSPFESQVTSGAYREAVEEAVAGIGGIEIVEAPLLSEMPEYVDYFAGATAAALEDLKPNEGAVVVFTAHSLPESDLIEDDPYVAGLERVASAVAVKLGMAEGEHCSAGSVLPGVEAFGSASPPRAWFLVFQSQGERPCAWLGPDLATVIDAASASEVSAVVVCPIGFMTDHMETLYDLDVVAAGRAFDAGLEWQRALVPNDYPSVLDGLASLVSNLV